MNKLSQLIISLVICLGLFNHSDAQKTDTAKRSKENSSLPYFIITAGTEINAFFNDKPVSIPTVTDFKNYVQTHSKSLKDSWIIVSGKPDSGTYNEVIKTLNHYRFKHVTKNIIKD
jgi:hypothetical protein